MPINQIQATINLSRLTHNLKTIKSIISPQTKVLVVVKANAYGHGLIPIASHLQRQNIDFFGVARLCEALELRSHQINTPILILSPIHNTSLSQAIKNHIDITVISLSQIKKTVNLAQSLNITPNLHLKIDTGMNRSGTTISNTLPLLKEIIRNPSVNLQGIFTHFSSAENPDKKETNKQLKIFNQTIKKIKKHLPKNILIHSANSAAIISRKDTHFNMVRPGLSLYGLNSFAPQPNPINLKPILKLETFISRIHTAHQGETIGYGNTHLFKKDTLIATIAAGYGDGLSLSPPWPYVSINQQLAPVIGKISMDQITLDISKIDPTPKINQPVTLISWNKNHPCSVDKISSQLNTINYQVLTSLSPRIKRKYIK